MEVSSALREDMHGIECGVDYVATEYGWNSEQDVLVAGTLRSAVVDRECFGRKTVLEMCCTSAVEQVRARY